MLCAPFRGGRPIQEIMKRISFNKFLIAGAVAVVGGFTSCEDYLTLYPTDTITKEYFWNTSNDVNNVRAAAYSQLADNTTKIVEWGELRSDNVIVNDMKLTHYRLVQEAVLQPTHKMFSWESMYRGINLCNEVLENGQRMVDQGIDPSFTDSEWRPIKAEMTALRALYYFYLVRSFRDVPFVTHSVSTDEEARKARFAAMPAAQLMDSIITQVEAALPYGAINYGNGVENHGRWTGVSMRALLADMYLWRAGLVMNAKKKNHPVKAADGTELTEAQEKDLATQSLKKVIEYADYVLKKKTEDFHRMLDYQGVGKRDERREFWYPLLGYTRFFPEGMAVDVVYNAVFGRKNSQESVFELQYDGHNNKNTTFNDMFYGNGSGSYRAGALTADPRLFAAPTQVDPVRGYGRTDFRFGSYALTGGDDRSSVYPIIKSVASSSTMMIGNNVPMGGLRSLKNNGQIDSNWQVYRLADIMMMKAEAIARLSSAPFSLSDYDKMEAIRACDQLFKRNNPGVDTLNTDAPTYCVRLRAASRDEQLSGSGDAEKITRNRAARYGAHGGVDAALSMVYNERQREFLGEGKRWYDIVRECEFRGVTKDVLSDWMSAPTNVRNRLRMIESLYNPIYTEELKVNGKNFGDKKGQLEQNPAWEKYMPKK